MMTRTAAVLLVGVGYASMSNGTADAQGRPSAQEAWRSSWTKFAEAVDEYQKATKEFPRATFNSLKTGQAVPDTWEVMKHFGGQVVFEGTLKAVTSDQLMEGMTAKLDLEMPSSKVAWLHVYPKATAIAAWKALAPGTPVKFRAVVKGVAGVQPLPGATAYMVLLQDAEIAAK